MHDVLPEAQDHVGDAAENAGGSIDGRNNEKNLVPTAVEGAEAVCQVAIAGNKNNASGGRVVEGEKRHVGGKHKVGLIFASAVGRIRKSDAATLELIAQTHDALGCRTKAGELAVGAELTDKGRACVGVADGHGRQLDHGADGMGDGGTGDASRRVHILADCGSRNKVS